MDFLKVFYAPSDVKYYNKKWLSFSLIALFIVAITFFLNVKFNYENMVMAITEKLSSMSEEQKTQVLKMLTLNRMLIQGGISLVVMFPLRLLFIAGVLYFVKMLIDEESFPLSIFAASIYIYIQAIGDFLKFLFSIVFKTFPFSTDLSLLVNRKDFVFGFLSAFDIFTIYAIFVVSIVISKETPGRRKYYFIVLFGLLVLWGIVKGFMINWGVK